MDWEITRLELDPAVVGKMGAKGENWVTKRRGDWKKSFLFTFWGRKLFFGFVAGHQ